MCNQIRIALITWLTLHIIGEDNFRRFNKFKLFAVLRNTYLIAKIVFHKSIELCQIHILLRPVVTTTLQKEVEEKIVTSTKK